MEKKETGGEIGEGGELNRERGKEKRTTLERERQVK